MPDEESTVAARTVDDMLIAGIRFLGQYEEIPEYFGKL